MKWRKPDPQLMTLLEELVPDEPAVQLRPMFGTPAYFAGGNMFAGVHQESMIVRLDDDARRELLQVPGAHVFEPMEGRPMREYVVLPDVVLADHRLARAWIHRGFEYAASLPPKEKKPRRRTS